jgi:hypothetical protein
MSYELIGHHHVRSSLASENQSFSLVGPSGVGRTGILLEWAQGQAIEFVSSLDVPTARAISTKALYSPGLTYAVDADRARTDSWVPLLKPLEENLMRLVAISTRPLPAPVSSRISTYRVGYLSEKEVLKILAKQFPTKGPRPYLAKVLMGSLENVERAESIVSAFEPIDHSLSDRHIPSTVRTNPLGSYYCLRLLCLAIAGKPSLPFSTTALTAIPKSMAFSFLAKPDPAGKNEARNLLGMFFSQVSHV